RAVHACDRARRGLPRRPLVVGAGRRERMRAARRCGGGAARPGDAVNAPTPLDRLPPVDLDQLDALEEEAIFILRETVAAFERPTLLFSAGKDSCVVLHLAQKAFKLAGSA